MPQLAPNQPGEAAASQPLAASPTHLGNALAPTNKAESSPVPELHCGEGTIAVDQIRDNVVPRGGDQGKMASHGYQSGVPSVSRPLLQTSACQSDTGLLPEVNSRHWWPRQLPVQSEAALDATPSLLNASQADGNNRVSSLSGALDEAGGDPVASWTSQRPAAASAAWAVRQQVVGHHAQQQAEHATATESSDHEGTVLFLDAAWPSLQDAISGVQKQPKQQEQEQQQLPQQLENQQLSLAAQHPLEADLDPGLAGAPQPVQSKHGTMQEAAVQSPTQTNCMPPQHSDGSHSQEVESQHTQAAGAGNTCLERKGPVASPAAPVFGVGHAHSDQAASDRAPEVFPQRPGQLLCDFYVRTGFCKFGQGCKFDHPVRFAVQLSSLGLPLRPHEPACPFYAKTGACKYGPSCKFHHPEP